jgi:hypothetical protein
MPKVSSKTLATGARQLVVQEALLTSWQASFSSWSLTPSTMMASTSVGSRGGTVRITFRAPASRCGSSSLRVRNLPVASITTSTPSSRHGSAPGSLSENRRKVCPSTAIWSRSAAMGSWKVPMMVSNLRR